MKNKIMSCFKWRQLFLMFFRKTISFYLIKNTILLKLVKFLKRIFVNQSHH